MSGLLSAIPPPLSGAPPLVEIADLGAPPEAGGAVVVGIDRAGRLPPFDPEGYDALVTTRPDAPAPWVAVDSRRLDAQLAAVRQTAARAPVATTMLARLLRTGEGLDFETAFELELLAYSTLLGGAEFAGWRQQRPGGRGSPPAAVRYERTGDRVVLTLASPESRNALSAAMRDALFEALANVAEDPTRPSLLLQADGRCFSTGGHLPEFGTARDLARAHLIRTARNPAQLLLRIGARAAVRVHGACIGSGVEIAAAAARRTGSAGCFFALPELGMGLIPGAGGTVTIARAIGRHRLMWLALGGFRLGAARAAAWGLLDDVVP